MRVVLWQQLHRSRAALNRLCQIGCIAYSIESLSQRVAEVVKPALFIEVPLWCERYCIPFVCDCSVQVFQTPGSLKPCPQHVPEIVEPRSHIWVTVWGEYYSTGLVFDCLL